MYMLSTRVESPGPPLVMMRTESNTLNEPVVIVINRKNSCGEIIGSVILKNVLTLEALSSRAAS